MADTFTPAGADGPEPQRTDDGTITDDALDRAVASWNAANPANTAGILAAEVID